VLSKVADPDPATHNVTGFPATSAAKPETICDIFRLPLPVHPTTLIVADVDGGELWAIVAVHGPAVAPAKVTLLVVPAFTMTGLSKFTVHTKVVVEVPDDGVGTPTEAIDGAATSFVTLTIAEVVLLPAASAMAAVTVWTAAESPVVSIVAEKLVPLQVPPAPEAEPSTLTVTACEASEHVPETAKVALLFAALI